MSGYNQSMIYVCIHFCFFSVFVSREILSLEYAENLCQLFCLSNLCCPYFRKICCSTQSSEVLLLHILYSVKITFIMIPEKITETLYFKVNSNDNLSLIKLECYFLFGKCMKCEWWLFASCEFYGLRIWMDLPITSNSVRLLCSTIVFWSFMFLMHRNVHSWFSYRITYCP